MKNVITIILSAMILCGQTDASDPDWNKWRDERNRELASAVELPNRERISPLGDLIRASGQQPDYAPSSKMDAVKREFLLRAQQQMLLVPGHAEYYDKRIRDIYAEFRDPNSPAHGTSGNRLQWEMMVGYETLRNLPSPETVKVLGEMLSDEWRHPIPPGTEYMPPSLAVGAVVPLAQLPFVDPPTPSSPGYLVESKLGEWQKWYAEVKAGIRTFAFKDQSEEYRFKPDGTWDTIPVSTPPEDPASKSTADSIKETVKPPLAKDIQNPANGKQVPWQWFLVFGLAILGLLAWFISQKRKS